MKCFDAPQPLHVASQRSNPVSSKFLSMYLAERFPLFWEEDANLSQPVIPLIALPWSHVSHAVGWTFGIGRSWGLQ